MLKRVAILLSYVLVPIGILAGTIIIVAYGQGYSYSLRTNSFSINGLLVMASDPSGAKITLDGKLLRRKTPYRSTLTAGLHDVSLSKDGFRTWTKRLQVLATGVTNWQNILLIPNELKSSSVVTDKPITRIITTRDRKRFAYLTSGADAGLWVLSADRKQSQKIYSPAAATSDKPAETIVDAAWADDGSHLLIRTQIGSETDYSVIASGGGQATNLTQLFKFDLSGLQFSPNDWHEMYWISPEGLRKLNVADKTVSAVLAEKVTAFTFAGNDHLAFVQQTSTGTILSSSDRSGGNQKRLVEAVAASASYQLAYSLYRGHDYITVLPSDTQTATVYGDVFAPNPTAQVISHSAKSVTTSDDGRFVGFIEADGYGAYDLDELLVYTNKSTNVANLSWFDETHLIINRDGMAEIVEYDGGNGVQTQMCGGPAYGSNDEKQIVCLAPAGNPNTDITSVDIKH